MSGGETQDLRYIMFSKILIPLILSTLVSGYVTAASTRRTPDNTYTECYDDGSCAQVSEWDYYYSTETVVNSQDSYDDGSSDSNWSDSSSSSSPAQVDYSNYDGTQGSNTDYNSIPQTRISPNKNRNSNTYTNSVNNNYYNEVYESGSPSHRRGGSSNGARPTSGSGHHNSYGTGSSGDGNGEFGVDVRGSVGSSGDRDSHGSRHHGGNLIGDLISLPAEIAGGVIGDVGGIGGLPLGLGGLRAGVSSNIGGNVDGRNNLGARAPNSGSHQGPGAGGSSSILGHVAGNDGLRLSSRGEGRLGAHFGIGI